MAVRCAAMATLALSADAFLAPGLAPSGSRLQRPAMSRMHNVRVRSGTPKLQARMGDRPEPEVRACSAINAIVLLLGGRADPCLPACLCVCLHCECVECASVLECQRQYPGSALTVVSILCLMCVCACVRSCVRACVMCMRAWAWATKSGPPSPSCSTSWHMTTMILLNQTQSGQRQ
jgi:hypothetical protein